MVPERIHSCLQITHETEKGGSFYTEGRLLCCGGDCFGISIWGKVKSGWLSHMYLTEQNHRLVLQARCHYCGKAILLFDTSQDGYDSIPAVLEEAPPLHPLVCKKCGEGNFSVFLRYEYPPAEELAALNLSAPSNRFTWIQATLRCNVCGAAYKKFLDLETG